MTNSLSILTVPAFDDNYLWVIHDNVNAIVVDPGDAAPVSAALHRHGLTLTAILLTHHHGDHTGGVAALLREWPVPVYGPASEAIPGVSHPLMGGSAISLQQPAIALEILDVPGHTRGHIAYYSAQAHWLFCGDTLFAGGCGRLFEGTPAQMLHSLDTLAALPAETQVFCAHEYTLSNLRFAIAAEPGNTQLATRLEAEQKKRSQGLPTVPSTIATERQTNPFLRIREAAIVQRLLETGKIPQPTDPVTHFAALREWKNQFH